MKIAKAAEILAKSNNIVVLTGAGISTESGIKDFRSRTGIYQQAPEYILSIDYFFKLPKEFYQFAHENLYHPDAEPNVGHTILAKWEKDGRVSQVITQNIDGLHQKAGSLGVIAFHGTMDTASCLNCGTKYSAEEMHRRFHELDDFYVCGECETRKERDRFIKPDVVLFGDAGEWFTPQGFSTILGRIGSADCILVLGTSLKVVPFSSFPQHRGPDVPLIIINMDETPYEHAHNTVVIHDSIGKTLAEIDKLL